MKKKLLINNNEYEVDLLKCNEDGVSFTFAGKTWSYSGSKADALFSTDGDVKTRYGVYSAKDASGTMVAVGVKTIKVEDATVAKSKSAISAGAMVSPMPGKVLKVFKKNGDSIKAGETVLVMEAMKMEHAIKAPSDGVIAKIVHGEGEQVSGGVLLVELEEV